MLYWQNDYNSTSIYFRNTLNDLGFEFVKDTTEINIDIKPTDAMELQSNKAYLFNLNVSRTTLKIFTDDKLKIAQKEILKTLKMIEKELE